MVAKRRHLCAGCLHSRSLRSRNRCFIHRRLMSLGVFGFYLQHFLRDPSCRCPKDSKNQSCSSSSSRDDWPSDRWPFSLSLKSTKCIPMIQCNSASNFAREGGGLSGGSFKRACWWHLAPPKLWVSEGAWLTVRRSSVLAEPSWPGYPDEVTLGKR